MSVADLFVVAMPVRRCWSGFVFVSMRLVVLVLLLVSTQAFAVTEQERAALIALYNATDGDRWTNNSGWGSPLGTECIWHGVICENNRVNALLLPSNQLRGHIPPEIGQLTELQWLSLGDNQLSGAIPPEIGQLTKLKSLNFSWNQLSDPIPSTIGQLAELQALNFSWNHLSGAIPATIGQLNNLESLNLNWNQLNGAIPPEIGQLPRLQWLSLGANQLRGAIPPEIGQLAQLKSLNLSWNHLSGAIPSTIGQLTQLESLNLGWNEFSGAIPPEIGRIHRLQALDLGGNQLTGGIPLEIIRLAQLQSLNLRDNQLTNAIPRTLSQMAQLRFLRLRNNCLTASPPNLPPPSPDFIAFIDGRDPGWQEQRAPHHCEIDQQFSLKVNQLGISGVTITANPPIYGGVTPYLTDEPKGITYQRKGLRIHPGTLVTLTAPPSAGGSWIGCDLIADSTCTVMMTQDREVTAAFRHPPLAYQRAYGSAADDRVSAIHVNGNRMIVAGTTAAAVANGAAEFAGVPLPSANGQIYGAGGNGRTTHAFVYQVNTATDTIDFVTLLAGSGNEEVRAMTVDAAGNIYLAGSTTSDDLPNSINARPGTGRNTAAFVAKLNSVGALQTTRYFGGTGNTAANAIALDENQASNFITIAGTTTATDLPQRGVNPFQPLIGGGEDGFIARFDADLSLRYVTYFGGQRVDRINALRILQPSGDLLFAGDTSSAASFGGTAPNNTFPKHAIQDELSGRQDIFLARLARGGNELVFGTYLGGSGSDSITDLVLSEEDVVAGIEKTQHYVLTGHTASPNWPAVNALYPTVPVAGGRGTNAFLAKVDSSGRFLHFSTYLGGSGDDRGLAVAAGDALKGDQGIAVPGEQGIYVAGTTKSTGFPLINAIQDALNNDTDGFVAFVDALGQAMSFSTYVGGPTEDTLTALATGANTGNIFFGGHVAPQNRDGSIDSSIGRIEGVRYPRLARLPTLQLSYDPTPIIPTIDNTVTFDLLLDDPTGRVIAFSETVMTYDPDVLHFHSCQWDSRIGDTTANPPIFKHCDGSTNPGEITIALRQGLQGGATPLNPGALATIRFRSVDATTDPTAPKTVELNLSSSRATLLGDMDEMMEGSRGVRLIKRRCNHLLGDCDCSGQVQIFEVQAAVEAMRDATSQANAPLCFKRDDRGAMTQRDFNEIETNYFSQIIEQL